MTQPQQTNAEVELKRNDQQYGDRLTPPEATNSADRANFPSRVRDHLANERTYLAWMRTAIALMGFGVVIARLRYILSPDTPGTGYGLALGLLFASIGLLTVLLSTYHYFSIRDAIDTHQYQPAGRWVVLFSLVIALLGTGVIYVLFAIPSRSRFPFLD
ncbi:DUF202 domain-containing protein [Oculatella sp. LEGE 06141]|uniref:YidH family protein n=1 Tax=Oculatella sp. LEGE 06141 TaxID=1828648 RepID=UPI0018827EE3|nr:DUF202 domain-containing protein [Oculatella sp. LEGE 06141]MBE9180296.1 DUF202 domain-containing protein [Oculatella sp. LEGE 06141]